MTDKERIEESVKRILPMVWDDKLGFDDVGQKVIGLIMEEVGVRQDFMFLHEREMERAAKEKDLWAKRFEECFDSKHGGKRKGAGRPKKEPTKTMRIPISKVEAVKRLIHD